jgi:hypothetical protein
MKRVLFIATLWLLAYAAVFAQLVTPTNRYTFAWDHPGTGVDHYEVRFRVSDAWVSVGKALQKTVDTLPEGSYAAAVRACYASVGSDANCEATSLAYTVVPPGGGTPREAPTNLRMTLTPVAGTAAYRSHELTSYTSRSGSTSVARPAGTVDGDYVLLVFVDGQYPNPTGTVTPPPGFILLPGFPSRQGASGFSDDLWVYYRIAAGEPATYTFTHTQTLWTEAMAVAVSGATGTPAVTIRKGIGATGTATGLNAPAGALVLFLEHNWELYGGVAPPAGTTPTLTERSDLANSLLYLASGVMSATGPTGNRSHANRNNSGGGWQACLIAFAPQ